MKRYKILIALVFLFGMGVPAEAQYFDWVKSYTSCAYKAVSHIERAVTDSEGNVYFLGHLRRGAEIDGEELLPEGIGFYQSICLVKLSPDGHMLWHKALGRTHANQSAANIQNILLHRRHQCVEAATVAPCVDHLQGCVASHRRYFLPTSIAEPVRAIQVASQWVIKRPSVVSMSSTCS